MVKLRYKAAQHTLLKGSQYIFTNDEIDVTKEEADYRQRIQPGMWEVVSSPKTKEAVKKSAIGKEVTKQNGPSNSK